MLMTKRILRTKMTMLMKTTNRMLDLWAEMEAQNQMGTIKKLYDSSIPYHIFATFTSGDRYYGIAFSYDKSIKVDTTTFDNLKEMNVALYDDPSYVDCKLLVINLLSPSHRDTFSSLCINLINAVKDMTSEKELVKAVVNQLEKWRNLFDKTKAEGMSTDQQQGLYGELQFLQKFLSKKITSPGTALDYWVGSDAALRDFQGKGWAVEAKTTCTNNPQKVTINGERQLDETLLSDLFLYHCSVEVSKFNGETLPGKVDRLRTILRDDIHALSMFNEKILQAGYFDEQAELYANRCYKIRDEHYYHIKNDFPRIREEELRDGVSDVKYAIILAMCSNYCIPENKLFNTIKSHE